MHYTHQFEEEWFYEQFMHIYYACIPRKIVYLAFSLLRLQKCFDNLKHVLKTLFVQSRCFVSNLILDRTGSVHML